MWQVPLQAEYVALQSAAQSLEGPASARDSRIYWYPVAAGCSGVCIAFSLAFTYVEFREADQRPMVCGCGVVPWSISMEARYGRLTADFATANGYSKSDLRNIELHRDELIEGRAKDPQETLNSLLRTIKPGDPPAWIGFVFTGAYIYRKPIDGNPGEEEWQISGPSYVREPGDWGVRIRVADRRVLGIYHHNNE